MLASNPGPGPGHPKPQTGTPAQRLAPEIIAEARPRAARLVP